MDCGTHGRRILHLQKRMLQSITVDSTRTCSDLCEIGAALGVDKSPYNRVAHRHPYTAVYSLLFARFKTAPVVFCEIGIGTTRSLQLWSHYFESPEATIYGFDCDTALVESVRTMNLPHVTSAWMDVEKADTISETLRVIGKPIDVLIDDSIHNVESQIQIITRAVPFLKSGGILIIEDVSRGTPEETYRAALAPILGNFSYASFVVTEHALRWSPGWDNDKLLVLIKK